MLEFIIDIMEVTIYDALKKRIESFTQISDVEWADFSSKWKLKEFDKDEYVLKAGQVEKYFYFIYEGCHRLFGDKEGEEINVGFSYNNEFSGVYDSFLAQQPSETYLQSISKSVTLRITYDDLMAQFDKYKSVERWGREFNAAMLILMARRQVESRSYSAEEKYTRLMNQSPHIFQIVPLKYLASYLGMTPETLSRLRKKVK
ncbi:MAG: Crp/Fnr family transcriptional regulator [Fulvivirga sp.]|uniref:Crp/Fnr family transcriptional regulator n=1 Tax=Fulvivirga sp. TaxID=1931237 RepID=UPI0032F09378